MRLAACRLARRSGRNPVPADPKISDARSGAPWSGDCAGGVVELRLRHTARDEDLGAHHGGHEKKKMYKTARDFVPVPTPCNVAPDEPWGSSAAAKCCHSIFAALYAKLPYRPRIDGQQANRPGVIVQISRESWLQMASQPDVLQSCLQLAAKAAKPALERCIDDAVAGLQVAETQSIKGAERDALATAWHELLENKAAWSTRYPADLLVLFKANGGSRASAPCAGRSACAGAARAFSACTEP